MLVIVGGSVGGLLVIVGGSVYSGVVVGEFGVKVLLFWVTIIRVVRLRIKLSVTAT